MSAFAGPPDMEPDEIARREGRLRRNARALGLTATKFRSDGLWRFVNENNLLESPEQGLTLDEAEKYLSEP